MEGQLAHIGSLAAIGSGAAAIGVGNVAGNYLAGAPRNLAAASQTATLFIGIAFAEALGIFSFLVALLLMFAVKFTRIHLRSDKPRRRACPVP